MKRRSHGQAIYPTLEPLESRTLLATCHVTRLGDFGAGGAIGDMSRGDLRFCINHANNSPGPDVITFRRTGTINLSGPLPGLSSDMRIEGPGADLLTVRRDTGGNYRIFTIPAGPTVEISGLTLSNGFVQGSEVQGGGIRNSGTLLLRASVITNNEISSQLSLGAGIYNEGDLTVIESTIASNKGSGVFGTGGDAKDARGGGIFNAGTLLIQSSSVASNWLYAYPGASAGGGIDNRGDLTVIDTTISGNRLTGWYGEGGGIFNDGSASIYGSTISNSIVFDDYGGFGGGVYNNGIISILSSTISNNGFASAGIAQNGDFALISHSTIVDNQLGPDGAGVWIVRPGTTFMRNTIVAGNGTADLAGTLASSGYNLIGNSTHGSGYAPTDILDVNPMLASLANNGGLTRTHALLPGSPAIDSGENSDAPEWDQRGPGFPRIVNGQIDIGAYEVQATGMPGIGSSFAFDTLHLSPVYGAFRAAVLGPALTPGARTRESQPAPFTGLLAVRLEPGSGEKPAINGGPIIANAERPVNGPENAALHWANIFLSVGAEGEKSPFSDGGIA
jgi:hypothetical protein